MLPFFLRQEIPKIKNLEARIGIRVEIWHAAQNGSAKLNSGAESLDSGAAGRRLATSSPVYTAGGAGL